MAKTHVLVHHPGTNHLAYELVAALQASGYDCDFHTGVFYAPGGALAQTLAMLPTALRTRAERELRRRAHAGVDPKRIHLRPMPELLHLLLGRLGANQDQQARLIGWRNDRLDAAVARVIRRERPPIVIGHDGSALLSGRAAHDIGGIAVLNQVVGHVATALEIFREEAARSPAFAETMVETPPDIVARCEAEIRESDAILVPSDYVRDTLLAHGAAADRIVVLPYGVDIERFRPAPREPDGKFRILFVGQLGQRKGILYLLEAVKRLRLPDVELALVGKRLGAEDAFAPYREFTRLVAHVPYHEVHRLFQQADLFVYPSLHEGSAFATYEALASGLPIVTTHNSGSVARDGKEGFIVPIRDIEALAARIEQLYRDRDLRKTMAIQARARACEFTWAQYGRRLDAAIDALVPTVR